MWTQRGAQMDAQTDEKRGRHFPSYRDWPLGGVSHNFQHISNLKMEFLQIFWDTAVLLIYFFYCLITAHPQWPGHNLPLAGATVHHPDVVLIWFCLSLPQLDIFAGCCFL